MLNYYKDNFYTPKTSTDIDDTQNEEETASKPIRTKLYVTNFPQHCTRRQLTEFFSKFGNVLECAIMWDSYAFIHYGSRKEASHALKQASNRTFMGNKLFIQLSTSRHRQEANWYQKEVEKLQNQLFSLKTSIDTLNLKDESLLPTSSTPTNLLNINETKLYVTNLPDNCNHNELKNLFEKYGNVLECVIMWNHYAFIHYSDTNEAKNGLLNLHGYVFYGKTLIVQYSTSSNRPLPKCKAFSQSENIIETKDSSRCESRNSSSNSKQNGLQFIKSYENIADVEKDRPATVLCYRASELENEFGVAQGQSNNKNDKDWIEILCKNINIENNNDISLSDIPTPDTPIVINKMPFVTQTQKLSLFKSDNTTTLTLDQIPTPPIPIVDNKITTNSSDSSSSIDLSDYPNSTSSNSVSPYTLSFDESEDLFENKKAEIENNFNLIKKYSRSRCLLVNSILYSELKEKLGLK